jgi:transposase-like protein
MFELKEKDKTGDEMSTSPSTQRISVDIKGHIARVTLDRPKVRNAFDDATTSMLEQYSNVKTIDGRWAVVRNGYLPEREIVTAVGPVPVQVPKVRDRSGSGIKFNSTIVPPYVRKSPRVSSSLPWLYLRGVSTGDMGEALSELLGEQAKGLSASVVSRLKGAWSEEYGQWNKRDLSASRWVYWWADGIHTQARAEDSDGQCLLVIIGVKPDGCKERVALSDGYARLRA